MTDVTITFNDKHLDYPYDEPEPVFYDVYDEPIYLGDIYYDFGGEKVSEDSLEEYLNNYAKDYATRCE